MSQSHPFIVPTFTNPNNAMLWDACCIGFFRFHRAGGFPVNETFDPSLHLTTADVQVDSSTNAHSFRVFFKCSKTDPFCKGLLYLPGSWFLPSLSSGFLDKLPSSLQARHQTSLYLPEWHSSLQVSAVFLSSKYPTISRYPLKVFRPYFSNWSCSYYR